MACLIALVPHRLKEGTCLAAAQICCQRRPRCRRWGKWWGTGQHPQGSRCSLIPDLSQITLSCMCLRLWHQPWDGVPAWCPICNTIQAKVSCERRTWQRRNEQNNTPASNLLSVFSFSLTWTALWMGNVIKDRYKLLCNTYLLPLWTWNRCRRWSREWVSLWSIASVLRLWCLCLDKYWQKYQPCHHLKEEKEIFLKPG